MKILKFIALMLILAGVHSCKEKVESGGDVPYKPCPCEEKSTDLTYNQKFYQGDAYLFKDSIPEQMGNQINNEIYSEPFPIVCWIVYYSETDVAYINFFSKNGINCIGTICNFPDFAKEWITTGNGCKVYYEGQLYEPCNPSGSIAHAVYIDYVLTKLKRK